MGRRVNRKRREKHLCKGRYVKYPDLMADGVVIIPGYKYRYLRGESVIRISNTYYKSWCHGEMGHVSLKFHKYKIDGEVIYA